MPKASSHGATVFAYLQKQYPTPRTAWEIGKDVGLSYSQVMTGINHIRTTLGPIHHEPLIYRPWLIKRGKFWIQHTYRLSASAAEVRDYTAWRFGIHVKQLRNLMLVAQAGAEKYADTELEVLMHTLGQAAETVEFVQKKLLGATP